MNNTTDNAANAGDVQDLIKQLDALQPGKQQQKSLLFLELYPGIERALARKVPQKTVIRELEKMGLSLSMGGFRSWLEAERKRRCESGESVRCQHCDSILPCAEGDATKQTLADEAVAND